MSSIRGEILASLRSRAWLACVAGAVVLGTVGGALPLLEVPGLELGLCVAIAAALLVGPLLGVSAARRAREGAAGATPVLGPFVAAATASLVLVALVFGAAALRAAVVTPCRPWGAPALFTLVAAPSALLSAAVAVAATVVARGRRWRAASIHVAVVLASLGATCLTVYFGPAAFALDHLLGVWPGPIYDEVIAVDARLLLFRVATLGWTGAALALGLLVARRRAGLRITGPLGALVAGLGVVIAAQAAGGAPPSRKALAAALGAVREGRRCVVHLAAERGPDEADRALRDCEYDAAAVARALGLDDPPRATVWIYRSPEEKRRLVGAAQTSYTKPWLAEIHVHDQGVPHPILRHELVHALASAAARGPLRVPARAMVGVDLGLVEGLAVAIDIPPDEYGIHGWARAMRDQGRLPPLRALLATGGFFTAPPSRAYVASGSFLRFLLDRRGAPVVLRIYRDDDLAGATGEPVGRLEEEWHRFLDGVEVPPSLATAAQARFERASLFARVCAREIAALEHDAVTSSARGAAARAERLLRRASALSGGDPGPLRAAAEAWRAAGDLGRAEAIAREALERAEAAPRRGLQASLRVLLGDLRLRAGDPGGAAAHYARALSLSPDRAESRALAARIAATDDPSLAHATVPWLLSIGDRTAATARLSESDAPLSRYLLARAELARGATADALASLRALAPGSLPDAAFEEEAQRLRAIVLCRAGRWDEGIETWEALARRAALEGTRAQARDGALRCAFDRDATR